MRDLVAGERADVAGEFALELEGPSASIALIALDAGRSASPAFPPIDSTTRELRPAAVFGEGGRLTIRLQQMPAAVERLLLVVFDEQGRPLRRECLLRMDGLRYLVDLRDRADAAVMLLELYRFRGGWRLAANGQGFSGGLVAVAAAHGVDTAWARQLGHGGSGMTESSPAPPGNATPSTSPVSSGSGVAVDAHHVLSNAHVVDDGGQVTILSAGRPIPAHVVFADCRNDLALLRVDAVLPAVARFRPGVDLHLGEDVVVLGFPLQGLLGSGPQASAGNIAALCGIGNDSSVFQFTAPIASGNSGGPILDMSGQLVGLVCSSLNLDHVRRAGASAENVNFGIKCAVVRSFLDAAGIEPQLAGTSDPVLGRAAVVRRARDSLCRIACSC